LNGYDYDRNLCPIHLLKINNEICVDRFDNWLKRSPQQEREARNQAFKLLSHSLRVRDYLQTKDNLSTDWFDWWTVLLVSAHNNF